MLKRLSGILTTVLSGWILHDRLLHRLRSWSWYFLQGSVVTQLRCGEIISQAFVANLLVNLSVKEVWESVNIWRSYGHYCSALFFWLTVYNLPAYETAKHRAKFGWPPLNDVGAATKPMRNSLKCAGVLQTHQEISAVIGPKFTMNTCGGEQVFFWLSI